MRGVAATAIVLSLLSLAVGCKRTAKPTAPARDESASAKPQPAPPRTDKPANTNANPKGGKDEPNWLTDPRFKKDQPKFDPNQPEPDTNPAGPTGPAGPSATGKQPGGFAPPAGGWTAPVPGIQPNPAPGGPGAGGPSTLPFGPGNVPPPVAPGGLPAPGIPNPPGMGMLQPNLPANPPPLVPGGNTPIGAAKKVVALADMRDIQIFVHDASLASGKMPTPGDIFVALVKAGSPAAEHVKSGAIILTGATEREGVWAYETRALTQGGLVVSQNGVETLTAAELKQRLGK